MTGLLQGCYSGVTPLLQGLLVTRSKDQGVRTRGTTSNQLEVVGSSVIRTTSKNKPPRCALRDSHTETRHAETTHRTSAAVCDCEDGDRRRTWHRRRGVEGAREGTARETRLGVSLAGVADRGADPRRARAGTASGAVALRGAAADRRLPTPADTRRSQDGAHAVAHALWAAARPQAPHHAAREVRAAHDAPTLRDRARRRGSASATR